MKKENHYRAVIDVSNMLSILLEKRYELQSLEQNQELRIKFDKFQSMTFDLSQRYGNPNYNISPYENELREISRDLRQYIAEQIRKTDISKMTIEALWEFFKLIDDINEFKGFKHSSGILYCKCIDESKCRSKKTSTITTLFRIITMNLKKPRLPKKKRQIFIDYLQKIMDCHNGSTAPHKRAEKLINYYKIKFI